MTHIYTLKLGSTNRTDIYGVYSKKHDLMLGEIKWHGPWRQYVFFPESDSLWSTGCLMDVVEFILKMMEAHKGAKK